MPSRRWRPIIDGVRRVMERGATSNAGVRRMMALAARELARASETGQAVAEARAAGIDDTYGASYFGEGRDSSGDRGGHSGYAPVSYTHLRAHETVLDLVCRLLLEKKKKKHKK